MLDRLTRARDELVTCTVELGRAARRGSAFWGLPGYFTLRRARRHYANAEHELQSLRVTLDLPSLQLPSDGAIASELIAHELGIINGRYRPLAIDDAGLSFEQRLETMRLEVMNLLEAVSSAVARVSAAMAKSAARPPPA